jgi:hypothetical protein
VHHFRADEEEGVCGRREAVGVEVVEAVLGLAFQFERVVVSDDDGRAVTGKVQRVSMSKVINTKNEQEKQLKKGK